MNSVAPKPKVAILRMLRDIGGEVSSSEITRGLEAYGLSLSSRTVRLYLKKMEAAGLVEQATRGRGGGRRITPAGIREIDDAVVFDRVGFTAAKLDRLAWEVDFDLDTRAGKVVLNVTVINKADVPHALREMTAVFRAGLCVGSYAALIPEGERLSDVVIPDNHMGIGTICSVTINGILLNYRISMLSRFGAVVEIRNGEPARFTDLIAYEGSTLDPLEIFIKAGLTSVHSAAITGNGRVGAGLREVPTSALPQVETLKQRLDAAGLGSMMLIGKPNQPVLSFPVQEGRTGVVLFGGLNPAAAVEEAGIPTMNKALCTLYDFDQLIHFHDLYGPAVDMSRQ